MKNLYLTKQVALLLIIEALLVTICFFILQAVFEFPAILNESAAHVLPLFYKNSSTIIPTYYAFTVASVLLIPLTVLLPRALEIRSSILTSLTIAVGVTTAIFQILGFIRWPFLVSYLATTYVNSQTTEVTRQSIVIFYQAFNLFAGHTVGEHLGFLLNALWGVLISVALIRSPLFASRWWHWLGWVGIALSLGILGNPLEDLGLNYITAGTSYFHTTLPIFNTIYLVSFSLWSLWLIPLAIRLFSFRMAQQQTLPAVE